MRVIPFALLVGAFVAISASSIDAQEWTRFRGPNGTGEVEDSTLPATFTEADFNWKIELPGVGHSSPVLWGNRLYVSGTKNNGEVRVLLCINATDGSTFWTKEFPGSTQKIHKQSSFASSTAAVDKDYVFFAVATADRYSVFALTHEGKEAWQVDLGPFISQHGFGTSPIVYKDMVVINNDQDQSSFLVALDRLTGAIRWKVPRKTAVVAYSTPCVYQPKSGPDELIFNSEAHGITSINPVDGSVNWEIETFNKRSVSSPLVVSGLIFGTCGSGGGGNYVAAVRPGEKPELAYKIDKGAPYVPTSVARGDLLFLWGDNGIVTCVKASTGEQIWQKRIGGNFNGSPVRAGDKLFCISAEGDIVVLRASEEFEELNRISLSEVSRSTPAIANGRIYFRTESHLSSLGGKIPAQSATK